MTVEINKQEAWKILDAIETYKSDYELSKAILFTFKNIEKKMKEVAEE